MHSLSKLNTTQRLLVIMSLLLTLALAACGGADGPDHALVFIDNGAIQCEFAGLSTKETAQILINNGIEVVSSACGHLTEVAVISQCGVSDININLHTIHAQHVAEARKLGFRPVADLSHDGITGYEVHECQTK